MRKRNFDIKEIEEVLKRIQDKWFYNNGLDIEDIIIEILRELKKEILK